MRSPPLIAVLGLLLAFAFLGPARTFVVDVSRQSRLTNPCFIASKEEIEPNDRSTCESLYVDVGG